MNQLEFWIKKLNEEEKELERMKKNKVHKEIIRIQKRTIKTSKNLIESLKKGEI